MNCPKCHSNNIETIDNVNNKRENEILRKKKCCDCANIFFTVEFIVEVNKRYEEEWAEFYRHPTQKKKRERLTGDEL